MKANWHCRSCNKPKHLAPSQLRYYVEHQSLCRSCANKAQTETAGPETYPIDHDEYLLIDTDAKIYRVKYDNGYVKEDVSDLPRHFRTVEEFIDAIVKAKAIMLHL